MYWSFDINKQRYFSWGDMSKMVPGSSNVIARHDVKVYSGEHVERGDSALFMIRGDTSLGIGDSVWIINYLREWYFHRGHGKCQVYYGSSNDSVSFMSHFLPQSFKYVGEYVDDKFFNSITHKLVSIFYWKDKTGSDKSMVDGKSLSERLFTWSGMEYNGLVDFRNFTSPHILHPDTSFYNRFKIGRSKKICVFQWHSSGVAKNLPMISNVKILKHLSEKYDYDIYVVGMMPGLEELESIPRVHNLSKKMSKLELVSMFAIADLIVCPDSAGVHLAEAFAVPCVCIMSTLTPSYIASKYKFPAFMFGSGHCQYMPCGFYSELPKKLCPDPTLPNCYVLYSINLNLFDRCVNETIAKVNRFKSFPSQSFYGAMAEPISGV